MTAAILGSEIRIIREYKVYGYIVLVEANSADDARKLGVEAAPDTWAWDVKEIGTGKYEVFVAHH